MNSSQFTLIRRQKNKTALCGRQPYANRPTSLFQSFEGLLRTRHELLRMSGGLVPAPQCFCLLALINFIFASKMLAIYKRRAGARVVCTAQRGKAPDAWAMQGGTPLAASCEGD